MWSCDIYLHMTRTEQRRQRAITIFRHVRSTMGCQTCGEKDPVVLELHHVIPIGKDRTRNFQSLTTVENDLALCTVVCANCHLRIGAKTIQSSPAMGRKVAADFVAPFRKKTTYRTGFNHVGTKFTQAQVEEIRRLHITLSYSQLATRFGVSKTTMVKVILRRPPYTT